MRGNIYEEKEVERLVGRFCKSGSQRDYTIETPQKCLVFIVLGDTIQNPGTKHYMCGEGARGETSSQSVAHAGLDPHTHTSQGLESQTRATMPNKKSIVMCEHQVAQ